MPLPRCLAERRRCARARLVLINQLISICINAPLITVVPRTRNEFFETSDFPDPTELSMLGFLTNKSREAATDKKTKQLLHYLDLAMNPKIGQGAAVNNFAAEFLRGLEYDDN